MRNNRGEWEYREPSASENYKFIRYTGLRPSDFEQSKSAYFWDEAKWLVIAVAFTVAFSCALSFALGYLVGE